MQLFHELDIFEGELMLESAHKLDIFFWIVNIFPLND